MYSYTSDSVVNAVMRRLGKHVSSRLSASISATGDDESLPANRYLKGDFGIGLASRGELGTEDIGQFAFDYMFCSLLKKYQGLNTGIDTEAVALKSWEGFEDHCRTTNARLDHDILDPGGKTVGGLPLARLISEVQRKIQDVIGVEPKLRVLSRFSRWSSGATLRTRRGAGIEQKMSLPIATTRRALPWLKAEIESDPHWLQSLLVGELLGPACLLPHTVFEIVDEDRFLVVPKDAKTGRSISAQPAGIAFLQQGVGRFFRHRLASFGVDLDDQSVNQKLAANALVMGDCTLDLKGASDTTALSTVWLLFPLKWANLLDDLRVKYSWFPGTERKVKLHKFSAMGNAFTFELESLIFWAICAVICSERGHDLSRLSVYGDDIIVPTGARRDVTEALTYFGFIINDDKSFSSPSVFYESCGEHFAYGVNVTPIYQKKVVRNLAELVRFHNRLAAWRDRNSVIISEDMSCAIDDCMSYCLSEAISTYGWLPRMPYGLEGDDGFWCDDPNGFDHFCPNRGFLCETLVFKQTTSLFSPVESYHLAYKLRRPSFSNSGPRGHVLQLEGGKFVRSERRISLHRTVRDPDSEHDDRPLLITAPSRWRGKLVV